ncbi:MAG TPA: hypothetical protein VKM72_29430 [Thermoanaerobaculia bacterium]|nr:hypothetical protein [Thermoanaerobaculia bacterium]
MSEPGVPPPPPYNPPPPPPPSGAAPTVSPNRTLMIVLSYLWILFLVPLLVEKDDPEVQWHAKHGLVIFLAEIILQAVLWVVSMVLNNIWGGFGCGLGLLGTFVWLGFLALRIAAIMKGVNGQRLIIPGISEYVKRF